MSMSDTELIAFRVASAQKQRIESAAYSKGMSVSSFILEAVLAAVQKTGALPKLIQNKHREVPGEFVRAVEIARNGGTLGYVLAGHVLMKHAMQYVPPHTNDEEWMRQQADLLMRSKADEDLDDYIWDWFRFHFPECMKLVRETRRSRFVAGAIAALRPESAK